MTYELAKELKDAGFDQEHLGGHYIDEEGYTNPKVSFEGIPEIDGDLYVPTLSELIEAVGEPFMLVKEEGVFEWKAHKDRVYPYGIGHTPEEAVARLWLALNRK